VNNVVVKWNPADASSISVWNSGGKPAPHYVTLPNRDLKFFKGISFWHWEKLREFAKQQDLDFNSEANRWKARDDLRKSWEKLARKMPMRQSRDARRGLAFSQGQFDGTNVNQPIDIDPNTVIEQEAEPSTDGLNQPEGVSDELAAYLLDPKNRPAKGRTPSKRTTAKAMRTKANNKKAAEQAKEAAEARERQGNPSGNPVSDTSRKTKDPSIPKTASTAGWEEEGLKDLDGADAPLAADQASSNSGWGDDFQ
jgi:putative transposase